MDERRADKGSGRHNGKSDHHRAQRNTPSSTIIHARREAHKDGRKARRVHRYNQCHKRGNDKIGQHERTQHRRKPAAKQKCERVLFKLFYASDKAL